MSIAHPPKTRGKRVYTRAFDHDEAQRRYDAGETIAALASEYQVTYAAVYQVVTESGRAAVARSGANFRERTVGKGHCDHCGGPMNLQSRLNMRSRLCRECANDDQATSVRADELRCVTCREWKPDEDFPRNRAENKRRRGRHSLCRACNTKQRQAYRERHKLPCVGCGAPALPPNEKGARGGSEPRCLACMIEYYRTPEFREAARERSLAALNGGRPKASRNHRQETASSALPR